MRYKTKKRVAAMMGYLIFFLTVAFAVTVALVAFVLVNRHSEGNTPVIAVAMFLVISLLSALCTVADMIRRRIMVDRPVRKILDATERIAAGDFSVRLQVNHSYERYDDYDLIMENLNIMAAELSKSEILKVDFISNVSHEIKTPLSIIRSYLSLLERNDLDVETRQKYTETVRDAASRLSDLVTNILQLNKMENRKLAPELAEIKLHDMLAESILHYEELISKKELELDCDLQETTLFSAPGYLEIVWSNLISNANKFTEKGGRIGVSLTQSGENAVVKISDTGCGISPETGARIFDKFYQGDTSHAGEGNGLGLALVKKVIDVLGGTISVESELGCGSTFTIVLQNLKNVP